MDYDCPASCSAWREGCAAGLTGPGYSVCTTVPVESTCPEGVNDEYQLFACELCYRTMSRTTIEVPRAKATPRSLPHAYA